MSRRDLAAVEPGRKGLRRVPGFHVAEERFGLRDDGVVVDRTRGREDQLIGTVVFLDEGGEVAAAEKAFTRPASPRIVRPMGCSG